MGSAQYERNRRSEDQRTVTENGLKFEVNLSDYLERPVPRPSRHAATRGEQAKDRAC